MKSYLPRDFNKENERPVSSYVNQMTAAAHRPASGGPFTQGKKSQAGDSRFQQAAGPVSPSYSSNYANKFSYLTSGSANKQGDLVNRSKSPPKSRANSPQMNPTDKDVSPPKKANIFFDGRAPTNTSSRLYPQSCKNSNNIRGNMYIEPGTVQLRTYSPKAGAVTSPLGQRVPQQLNNSSAKVNSKRSLHQSKYSSGASAQLNQTCVKGSSDNSASAVHRNQLSLYLNYFNNSGYQSGSGSISSGYTTVTSDKILSSIKPNLPNNSLLLKKLLEKKSFIESRPSDLGARQAAKPKIIKQKNNSDLPSKQLSTLLNGAKQKEVRDVINKVKERPNLTLQDDSCSFRLDNIPTPNKSAILIDHPPIFPRNRTGEVCIGSEYNSQLEAKRRAKRKAGTKQGAKVRTSEFKGDSEARNAPGGQPDSSSPKLEPFRGQLLELNTLINELNQAENQQNIEMFHTRLEMLENKIVNIKTKINSNNFRRQSGDRKNFTNSIFFEHSEEKIFSDDQFSESNRRSSPVDVTLKELVYRIENSNSSFVASKETSISTKSPRNEPEEDQRRFVTPNSFMSDIPEERCRQSGNFIKEGVGQLRNNVIVGGQLGTRSSLRTEELNLKRMLERAELYYIRNMINSYFFDEKERSDVDLNTRYLLIMYREHFFQSMEAVSIAKSLQAPSEEQIKEKMIYLPRRKTHLDKRTLIFDLDETLIHCNEVADENSDVILTMKFPTGQTIKVGLAFALQM